jgi:hypothetical protein
MQAHLSIFCFVKLSKESTKKIPINGFFASDSLRINLLVFDRVVLFKDPSKNRYFRGKKCDRFIFRTDFH